MTGYQEVLTDPSYRRQIVAMTAPHIGNTGVNAQDEESSSAWLSGFVVRRASITSSSWRAEGGLNRYLLERGVIGITGTDTRALVRHIREKGAMHGALVTDGGTEVDAAVLARNAPDINSLDLVGEVSCSEPYEWSEPMPAEWSLPGDPGVDGAVTSGLLWRHIVVYDFGVKRSTLRQLVSRGCRVTVVPSRTSPDEVMALGPDGLVLSNGPGDPAMLEDIALNIRQLLGWLPIFGICLGHQLLGLALGGATFKLKFGHRGVNHPVRDERTGVVAITSHNHGYALAADSLPGGVEITHISLNDGCVEGIAAPDLSAFGVQFHPEAAPGTSDATGLFDSFLTAVDAAATRAKGLVSGAHAPAAAAGEPSGAHGSTPGTTAEGGAGAQRPSWDLARATGQRMDLRSVLIIGSGPIVIGQACEFDYSGTQACKALRRDGYRVILVNSNPATIMTEPELADATYIEPLTVEVLEQIIESERPDAILPTVGGQTGLNVAVELAEKGVLERFGVDMIGATVDAVRIAEDRAMFRQAMLRAGLDVPRGAAVGSVDDAIALAEKIGYPVLVRPSFTLGGTGGAVAPDRASLERAAEAGLRASPAHQVLIEESVLGWKEFELEVMRDGAGNFVVVCSIENLDPMGVHTGDSITVAPAMTLTDREYQRMRDMAHRVMDVVGLSIGGSNVQFAVSPADGRIVVIEMNPRVSRSSALASKATGFPIAKIAALVAVGHALDDIPNDITRVTPASFEPSLDYVVVKIPRFDFQKFPGVDEALGPQMKSVGEAMAVGDTFAAALNKALRSLEAGIEGIGARRRGSERPAGGGVVPIGPDMDRLRLPVHTRLIDAADALARGASAHDVAEATGYDPWFVGELAALVALTTELSKYTLDVLPPSLLRHAKENGVSDAHIARLCAPDGTEGRASEVRALRKALAIEPTFRRIDTCAAEFEARTPYLYSAYPRGGEDESRPTNKAKVMVLGGGPNRIGQGIEFDYCCVHACQALSDLGYETIMVNCNPETVSTDYDTADRLYFEPLTVEDVLAICEVEKPAGVLAQFGGQTPLNLARELEAAGVPIWGTSPETIDLAEDRQRFGALLDELEIPQPEHGIAASAHEAVAIAERIGFPVLVRPSYVLGGRGMAIVFEPDELERYLEAAEEVAGGRGILVDSYLEDAYEVDVDAVCDGEMVVVGGVMQHIEEAGVHSGDSSMVLPPYRVSAYHLSVIREYTQDIGLALDVRGLMNIQFAIKDDIVYVLEVNPRASRTVPFVSKATGVPLARIAAEIAAGRSLSQIAFTQTPPVDGFFVKEAVLPFGKLPGSTIELGPEMKSTGEVMGHASRFGQAFAKASLAAGQPLPTEGTVLLTVNDLDKAAVGRIARDLARLGFDLMATSGTADWLARLGLQVESVNKVSEGSPHVVDAIASGRVQLVVSTPLGPTAFADGQAIRSAAVRYGVPLLTTLSAAAAAVTGVRSLRDRELRVRSLQKHYLLVPSRPRG